MHKYRLDKQFKHSTVTSRLFTHIVSTEKMGKDMRDRKDMRGTKYTNYNSCFLILLSIKSILGTSPLFQFVYFIYTYENKR